MGKKLGYSILACVYGNHRQFSNFLWTAYCQDFDDFEIVIVDNATPGAQIKSVYERTPRKIRRMINYIYLPQKEKRCRNINQGINIAAQKAAGKYLVIVADPNVMLSFNLLDSIDELIDDGSVVLSAGCNDIKISPYGSHESEYGTKNPEEVANANDVMLDLMGWPCDPLHLKLIPGKHRYPPPHQTYDCYIVALSKNNYLKSGGMDEGIRSWGEYHQKFVKGLTKWLKPKHLHGVKIIHQFHRVYKDDPI